MATSQATPAAMPAQNFSGMSLDSAIDSISVPETSTSTPSTPATETTPEPPAPAETAAPEPEAQAEETQEAAPPSTPEPEISDYDEIKPDRETDGGKTLHFSANKAKALMAARDFHQRVQEAIPNATIEDLADNFRRTVELDRMLT